MNPHMTHVPYTGEHDYQRLRTFLQSMFPLQGPCPPITIGDLDYWRFQHSNFADYMQSCGLWQAPDETLVGFAWPGIEPDGTGIIDLSAHPQYADLLPAMLTWSEAWLQHAMPDDPLGLEVTVSALEHNTQLTALLTTQGYTRTADYHYWYRVRSLAAPVPDGVLPPGYTIRPIQGASDIEPFAELNNRTGAGPELTAATFRAMMGAPTYRRDLHLVVCAPDTTLAAFCIIWYDAVNRMGLFEPVGCHPDHQRQGLSTAMMREGLRRLQQLGATRALVASSRRNQASNALYESLGFISTHRKWRWKKTLYK